jgi:hypothetical protein
MPETSQNGIRMWWTELIATFLLGAAAVGAGWAAYQSALWNSDSLFTIDQSAVLRRKAGLMENRGYQMRMADLGMFTVYMQAVTQNNKELSLFVLKRFRPPMKVAVDAWLATDPLRNPDAPSSPFAMKAYHLPEDDEARQLHEQGEKVLAQARVQNRTADDYVLITVPFAVVSLFSGLSTKFSSRGIRMAIVAMALAFFIGAVIALASMPVSS